MNKTLVVVLFFVCAGVAGVAAAAGSEQAVPSSETLAFLSTLAAPEVPAASDLFAGETPAPIALACAPDFCSQAQKDECDDLCYPCNGRHTCNFQTCVFSCTCGFNCHF